MKKLTLLLSLLLFGLVAQAQVSSQYFISFENAVHHEAHIQITFSDLESDEIEFRMSRSSPGRYALHEFAKNIYQVKVTDSKGKALQVSRPDPYAWKVKGHDGSINVSYTLFANHGDGTYAQIDETHAHLNMPASFMYVPSLSANEIEITFDSREDLNWKIATQLKHLKEQTYYAKTLAYFMDSPVELSNHSKRSFDINGQTINFILHHQGTEAEFDAYFEKVKKVVLQEMAVFGELPDFDYKNYYFLACYMPQVDGDGMEHRNSTILTSTRQLNTPGFNSNIGTVSHEFFHAWNVERFRPKSLEPFDFTKANMSGELWFAEGFTSYYTGLLLCRAGLMDPQNYLDWQSSSFNYVWNSTGRRFHNPIEMSYQAPFVDAAKAVDQENKRNTFISYYNYGAMLGLALDLSLREKDLNLDDYMKSVWIQYGKTAIPYTNSDLHQTLSDYAGNQFADDFFNSFIYSNEKPNFEKLFQSFGIHMRQDVSKVYFGTYLEGQTIGEYPAFDSPAYLAGLTKGDKILQIGANVMNVDSDLNKILESFQANDKVNILFERFGQKKQATILLQANQNYSFTLFENASMDMTDTQKNRRYLWLQQKE